MHEDEQIIILPNTTIYLDPNYGGNKEDLLRFMDSLKNIGVKDINRDWIPLAVFYSKSIVDSNSFRIYIINDNVY